MKMILSYVLALMQVLGLMSCTQKPEPETYLIPEGFRGRATVIFNQKEGAIPKYEKGRRIYEMPANGILLTQFKDEYGFLDHQYYYVNGNGNRKALQIYKYKYNKDGTTKWIVNNQDEIGVFLDGTTGQYAGEDEPRHAPFQLFIVSSNNDLDSFYTKKYQQDFNDMINKLIGPDL
jgi:hypothetical protein